LTRREGLAASDRVRGEAARVNNERDFAYSDREIRDEPMEGALVRAVLVVLNRRRASGPGSPLMFVASATKLAKAAEEYSGISREPERRFGARSRKSAD
jgi:hypothetical protein